MVNPVHVSGSERLPVTLLSIGERTAVVLDAYFSGPGRKVFVPTAEAAAQVAIADLDHPESLAHLKRFQLQSSCPVIVLAMADPMLPGTVWVAKPASPQTLQEAAVAVRLMLQQAHEASQTPEPQAPEPVVETPPVPEVAEVVSAAPTPAPELLYARRANEPGSGGHRRMPLVLGGLSLISLALVSLFLLRPTGTGSGAGSAAAGAKPAPVLASPELESAVASSLHDVQAGATEADKAFIEAQRAQLARSKASEEDIKAKLDRLASNPEALAEYNRSVMNKVHVTGKGGVAAPERSVRGEIDSILSEASAASAASSDRFATSLQPEAKQHEAETRTIVVQPGDTLSSIALRAYGDQAKYPRIFEANPRILTSPNHIFPGQVLRVPNT